MDKEEHKKIKKAVKNTFDTAAKDYDSSEHFIISAEKFVELIKLDNSKDINILDLSTGTGNLAIELAKKFPNTNIYAVDISHEMLKQAQEKTQKMGIKNITYLVQDVEHLELDMKFDLITCGYGLFFYPNLDSVFYDICSRLKPNGKFAFSTFTTDAFEPYSQKFLDILEKDFDIKPPQGLKKRTLKTKNEINELSSLVKYNNLDIHNIDIRYDMAVDILWKLFNSAGYKGLLNQLGDDFPLFEKVYLDYLYDNAKNNYLEFNADSYIAVLEF